MEDNPITFTNREQWREWLKSNHSQEKDAWLVFYKKHVNKPGISLEEATEEALCFGWIDSKQKRLDEERFILRYSPRKPNSVWSKVNKEKAEQLIKKGKVCDAGLKVIEQAKKSGSWNRAYTNLKGNRTPSDLKIALAKNKIAIENFQRFAKTYRNMYIYWVNNAKTAETRKKRIEKVVEQALNNQKLLVEWRS